MENRAKKELNFELNLLPVISVLAVCTAFLLLTTVWVHIGSLTTAQAYGSVEESNKDYVVYVKMSPTGTTYTLEIKKDNASPIWSQSNLSQTALATALAKAKNQYPKLSSGLVQPTTQTKYLEIIQVMDIARQNNVKDLGVAPL